MTYIPDNNITKVGGEAVTAQKGLPVEVKALKEPIPVAGIDEEDIPRRLFVTQEGILRVTADNLEVALANLTGTARVGNAAQASLLIGGMYTPTTAPVVGNNQQISLQVDAAGNLRVATAGNIGSFTSKTTSSAGAESTLTVPAGTKWRFVSGATVLVASATAGNRVQGIRIRDASSNTISQVFSALTVTAGVTNRLTFGPGLTNSTPAIGSCSTMPFPAVSLGPAFILDTQTSGLLAGDTLTLYINVEVYSD